MTKYREAEVIIFEMIENSRVKEENAGIQHFPLFFFTMFSAAFLLWDIKGLMAKGLELQFWRKTKIQVMFSKKGVQCICK